MLWLVEVRQNVSPYGFSFAVLIGDILTTCSPERCESPVTREPVKTLRPKSGSMSHRADPGGVEAMSARSVEECKRLPYKHSTGHTSKP